MHVHRVVLIVVRIPKKSAPISLDKRTCQCTSVYTYPYGGQDWSIKIPAASDIRAKSYHLDGSRHGARRVEGRKERKTKAFTRHSPCRASRVRVHHVFTDVYANKRTTCTCSSRGASAHRYARRRRGRRTRMRADRQDKRMQRDVPLSLEVLREVEEFALKEARFETADILLLSLRFIGRRPLACYAIIDFTSPNGWLKHPVRNDIVKAAPAARYLAIKARSSRSRMRIRVSPKSFYCAMIVS